MPEVKFISAHGQMPPGEIEDKMKARVYELIGIDDTDYDAIAEHKAGLTGSHLD